MKPCGATELHVPSDLSIYSFADAMRMLMGPLGCKVDPKENISNYTLRVASQGFSQAMMLVAANGGDISVEMDLSYSADEWSLHYTRHYPGPVAREAVWSPGA